MNSEQIWSVYHTDLRHYILSEVKNKDIANDLLQEVFIKMHTHLCTLKEEQKCKQWLLRIAKNTITDYYRKEKKTELNIHDLIEEENEPSVNEGFAKCLTSFIPELPQHYRDAVLLADINNQNQKKIAEQLKISYSGVKSRVQRGRELLKSLIKKCCNVSSDKYGNIISYTSEPTCKSCGSYDGGSVNRC